MFDTFIEGAIRAPPTVPSGQDRTICLDHYANAKGASVRGRVKRSTVAAIAAKYVRRSASYRSPVQRPGRTCLTDCSTVTPTFWDIFDAAGASRRSLWLRSKPTKPDATARTESARSADASKTGFDRVRHRESSTKPRDGGTFPAGFERR